VFFLVSLSNSRQVSLSNDFHNVDERERVLIRSRHLSSLHLLSLLFSSLVHLRSGSLSHASSPSLMSLLCLSYVSPPVAQDHVLVQHHQCYLKEVSNLQGTLFLCNRSLAWSKNWPGIRNKTFMLHMKEVAEARLKPSSSSSLQVIASDGKVCCCLSRSLSLSVSSSTF
jgi:hypothetical protein